MKAFVTGSYAYGTPHAGSDVDLVIYASDDDAKILSALSDAPPKINEEYPPGPSMSLRFGKLNLIVCVRPEYYNAWAEGTAELLLTRPIHRDKAMRIFQQHFKAAKETVRRGV